MMRAMVVLCCLTAVAHADVSAPSPAPAGTGDKLHVLATLERTACYGTCPIYKMTIFSNGRVEWQGEEFVKVKGKASATLSVAELSALKAAFRDAKYFDLGDGFDCYEVTDHPSANTSYDDGSRKKSIKHYHGCKSKPGIEALSALEAKIDQIVKSDRWVGASDERRKNR